DLVHTASVAGSRRLLADRQLPHRCAAGAIPGRGMAFLSLAAHAPTDCLTVRCPIYPFGVLSSTCRSIALSTAPDNDGIPATGGRTETRTTDLRQTSRPAVEGMQ